MKLTTSKVLSPHGICTPSKGSTGILVFGLIRISMPLIEISERRWRITDAIVPSPQPTSRTEAPDGNSALAWSASTRERRSNTSDLCRSLTVVLTASLYVSRRLRLGSEIYPLQPSSNAPSFWSHPSFDNSSAALTRLRSRAILENGEKERPVENLCPEHESSTADDHQPDRNSPGEPSEPHCRPLEQGRHESA